MAGLTGVVLTAGFVRALDLADAAGHRPLEAAWRAGAKISPLVEAGQWWRVVVAPLHHLEVAHFLLNAAVVASMGALFAALAGVTRAVLVFLTGAWAGTLASVWLNPPSWSLGASAGGYALTGALIGALAAGPWLRSRGGQVALALAAMLVGLQIASGGPTADVSAHGAGLVFGFVAGLPLGRAERSPAPGPWRTRHLPRLALAGSVLLVAYAEGAQQTLVRSLDDAAPSTDAGERWPTAPGWIVTREAPTPKATDCRTNGLATVCILPDSTAAAGAWLGCDTAPEPAVVDVRTWVRNGLQPPSPESPTWRSVWSVPPSGPTIGVWRVAESQDVAWIDRHVAQLRESLWSPP
jgi:membrane associated rhomboid family serine protease